MSNIYYGHMFGWGFGGGIMMLVFWIAFALLVLWAIKAFSQGRDNKGSTSASDILKERYAKGEINKEEFEQKRKDLL